jgi:hypothetical protein
MLLPSQLRYLESMCVTGAQIDSEENDSFKAFSTVIF